MQSTIAIRNGTEHLGLEYRLDIHQGTKEEYVEFLVCEVKSTIAIRHFKEHLGTEISL